MRKLAGSSLYMRLGMRKPRESPWKVKAFSVREDEVEVGADLEEELADLEEELADLVIDAFYECTAPFHPPFIHSRISPTLVTSVISFQD